MKMAAAEAHWNTADDPDFSIIAIPDTANGENRFSIEIPGFLSFLSFNQLGREVEGINDLQARMAADHGEGNFIPPVWITFYSFRVMVAAGGLMLLLALIGAFWYRRGTVLEHTGFLRLLLLAIALPYLANSAGWLLAEVGRQPWIVYEMQTAAEGVSTVVSPYFLLFSLLGFTALYGVLAVVDIYLLAKFAKQGPTATMDEMEEEAKENEGEEVSLWT